jgi:hypothetical protein
MPLALVVDKIDAVPEALRSEYTEKDGKFHLNVEGLEDTTGLKSALQAERTKNKTIKDQVTAWEKIGKSPEEIEGLLEAERVKAEEALKRAGKFDEILATHKSDWAKEAADKETKLTGERDSALTIARKAIVNAELAGSLTKHKATPEGFDLLTERLGRRVKVDFAEGKESVSILAGDGTPMVGSQKNGLATFDDLVKEAVKQYPSLFEGSGAGGSGAPAKGGTGGGKTLSRKDWDGLNPFEQAAKIKEGIRPID